MGTHNEIDTEHWDMRTSTTVDAIRGLVPSGNHRFRFCQSCGEEISPARREAIPGVMFCIVCADASKHPIKKGKSDCSSLG
jgi:RNA polymerase-binding transcription factor DksA